MDTGKVVGWWDQVQPILLAFGLKVIGAIVVFIVGRWLIRVAATLMGRAMSRQRVDSTVQHYIVSFVSIALNVVLVVAILGYFGVETTSFAALVAGLGVAVGAAWGGLLSNFAAGAHFQFGRSTGTNPCRRVLPALSRPLASACLSTTRKHNTL